MPRRGFLALLGFLGLAACGGGSSGSTPVVNKTVAFRLSTRGRRASQAAKSNAANKRFVSRAAAEAGRAHPGDSSRVVSLDVSSGQWDAWFGGGRKTADLRRL
jgi:hypothetical protein